MLEPRGDTAVLSAGQYWEAQFTGAQGAFRDGSKWNQAMRHGVVAIRQRSGESSLPPQLPTWRCLRNALIEKGDSDESSISRDMEMTNGIVAAVPWRDMHALQESRRTGSGGNRLALPGKPGKALAGPEVQ